MYKRQVIKNVIQIWGELPLAIIRQTGELSYFKEYFVDKDGKEISIENKNFNEPPSCAVCEASRKGESQRKTFFLPKLDIDASGVKDKDTWKKHLKTMWRRRCRKIMINDLFPDVMYGVKVYEYDGDIISKKEDNKQIASQVYQDFGVSNDKKI